MAQSLSQGTLHDCAIDPQGAPLAEGQRTRDVRHKAHESLADVQQLPRCDRSVVL